MENEDHASALHVEHDYGLESIFAALKCPVVNRLADCFSNQSKPFQAWQLGHLDLSVPCTLVTDSLSEAKRFYERWNRQVIYKSAGGGFIGTRRLTEETLSGLFSKPGAPVQLQELVSGTDIRVHVVGDQLFATRILSDAIDYRFPRPGCAPLRMESAALPRTVSSTCIRVSKLFGLVFSGIDLRETADGQFYFFEANPAPAFSFYEGTSGQPISKALVDLLRGS
jgi:glutathione synthase/RimK-type ligase-like ATP-grasp enzyme